MASSRRHARPAEFILPRPTVLRDTALQVEDCKEVKDGRGRWDGRGPVGARPPRRRRRGPPPAAAAGPPPERRRRMSARRKQDAVLKLLRGEDLELLSRQLGVTAADLSG